MVMKRLNMGCRTVPCNYNPKGYTSISNPVAGATVTEEHWARAKAYEEEIARQVGKSYDKVARELVAIADEQGE